MDTNQIKSYLSVNTLTIFIILILIIASSIYFYQSYKKFKASKLKEQKQNYKPNDCPDYWDVVSRSRDDKGRDTVKCQNTHKLGLCSLDPERNTFTFDDEIFVNPLTKDVSRCKWAKQCSVSWSGYNNLCSN
jgi:hypothetical protein